MCFRFTQPELTASFDTADEFYLHNFCIPSQKANKCKVLVCGYCHGSLLAATNSSSTTMEQHPVTSVQPCDCCIWNVSAGLPGHADTLHMHANNVTSVREFLKSPSHGRLVQDAAVRPCSRRHHLHTGFQWLSIHLATKDGCHKQIFFFFPWMDTRVFALTQMTGVYFRHFKSTSMFQVGTGTGWLELKNPSTTISCAFQLNAKLILLTKST